MQQYQLVNSGSLQKLERFGTKLLKRSSSVCAWSPLKNQKEWDLADAELIPGQGWEFRDEVFEEFTCEFAGINLILRPQSNGQIGVFPEHATYLEKAKLALESIQKSNTAPARVLNLFAYTGLASAYLAKHGAHVTHVDNSKKTLTWANANFELNQIKRENLRLMNDDVGKFLEREARRASTYDIVVVDPPSFSRVSKNETWTLEEVLAKLIMQLVGVLNPKQSYLFFTNHSSVFTTDIASNLLKDHFGELAVCAQHSTLRIEEVHRPGRFMPCGSLLEARIAS